MTSLVSAMGPLGFFWNPQSWLISWRNGPLARGSFRQPTNPRPTVVSDKKHRRRDARQAERPLRDPHVVMGHLRTHKRSSNRSHYDGGHNNRCNSDSNDSNNAHKNNNPLTDSTITKFFKHKLGNQQQVQRYPNNMFRENCWCYRQLRVSSFHTPS